MNDRSRWLVLAALGLLLLVLTNSHFVHLSPFHGGFRLFGFHPLLTAILLAAGIWFLLVRCSGGCSETSTADPAEPTRPTEPVPPSDMPPSDSDFGSEPDSERDAHENEEDPDITG